MAPYFKHNSGVSYIEFQGGASELLLPVFWTFGLQSFQVILALLQALTNFNNRISVYFVCYFLVYMKVIF